MTLQPSDAGQLMKMLQMAMSRRYKSDQTGAQDSQSYLMDNGAGSASASTFGGASVPSGQSSTSSSLSTLIGGASMLASFF
uniref:Uncharacterized protein n=2 Tax=unclassified Microvirus TaxID=338099 RepID=A0AAU8B749_9VIRU